MDGDEFDYYKRSPIEINKLIPECSKVSLLYAICQGPRKNRFKKAALPKHHRFRAQFLLTEKTRNHENKQSQ